MIKIEVCAASIESVEQALKGGASRVELCSNLQEGGTTPPLSLIKKSLEYSDIQSFVLIRPRSGDFLYTENEYNTMKWDIIHCGEAKSDGVVFGILTKEGKVDIDKNKELLNLAKSYKMSATFHRAIDRTENILVAMEDIINLGFDRILTSGGEKDVIVGKRMIKKMINQANERIVIMPGGGVNEDNIALISEYLNTSEFHGSFRKKVDSEMKYKTNRVDLYENEYMTMETDAEKIKSALRNANKR